MPQTNLFNLAKLTAARTAQSSSVRNVLGFASGAATARGAFNYATDRPLFSGVPTAAAGGALGSLAFRAGSVLSKNPQTLARAWKNSSSAVSEAGRQAYEKTSAFVRANAPVIKLPQRGQSFAGGLGI